MHRHVPESEPSAPVLPLAFAGARLDADIVAPKFIALVLPNLARTYVPTAPAPIGILAPGTVPELSLPAFMFAICVFVTVPLRSLFPLMLFVLNACSLIFGAPAAPSAIAIGLSRKAKPSIARMGLPGSILSVGILVHCAIFHLTKSTCNPRRSQRHRVCAH